MGKVMELRSLRIGRQKLIEALGKFEGDPFDAAVERLAAKKAKPAKKPKTAKKAKPAEPQHTGGGWYTLPDGRRVKGKAAALAAMGEGV